MDNKLVILYKIISLLVGLVSIVLGYRLFVLGVLGPLAALEAGKGSVFLTLKNAAPGSTFFALFGASIIALTIYKGLNFVIAESFKQSRLNEIDKLAVKEGWVKFITQSKVSWIRES